MSNLSGVSNWVTMVREPYSDLPQRLTEAIEDDVLEKLQGWRQMVSVFRERYNTLPEDQLPSWIATTEGGSAVIPVLWAQQYMSEIEVRAWHRLFACASSQLASIAQKHWNVHKANADDTVELTDVLEYLPIAFLFVLGNYNPYAEVEDHEVDFSSGNDKNVRLTTWIHIEGPRHIKKYIQQEMYNIGNKASYMHRLRSQVNQLQDTAVTTTGSKMPHNEIVDEIQSSTYYGQTITRESLSNNIRHAQQQYTTVSTEAPVSPGSQESAQVGDMLKSNALSSGETGSAHYILSRTAYNSALQCAIEKLLFTDEELSVDEQFVFNSQ